MCVSDAMNRGIVVELLIHAVYENNMLLLELLVRSTVTLSVTGTVWDNC